MAAAILFFKYTIAPDARKEALMKILVTPPFTEEQKKQILSAAADPRDLQFCLKKDITPALLKEAEVILGNLENPDQLQYTEHLQWIQLNNAGTEGYCIPGRLPETAVLTNATGAYGLAISEHMLACLFLLRKKLDLYYVNQLQCRWKSEGHVGVIQGTTALIIGLGDIGTAFAAKMKALGCHTIGIKRRVGEKPSCVDELYGMEALDSLLPGADVVAMSLPGNPSTYHVLNRERIALLSPGTIVLNAGRGTAIDTDALCEALYAGKIAGAALDVTDPEPLPADHPLWKAPGAVITPHISGGYALPETLQKIAEIFAENLKRYQSGKPLMNVVDPETGYSSGK